MTEQVYTENGALAHNLKSKCLHLFSKIGALRNASKEMVINLFHDAVKEDEKTAMQILFWGRDARQGAGERKTFHDIVAMFVNMDFIARNAKVLINIGYAKDLIPYFGNDKVVAEWAMILKGSSNGVRSDLVAKWTPRKGKNFKRLRDRMNLTNKELRKLLVDQSHTVEQLMSAKEWDSINFSSVPGRALKTYSKSFDKHMSERFIQWKEDKASKASVSATYPHEIIQVLDKDVSLAQKMWDNLPQLTDKASPLIMADTSGSMTGLPMDVSVALGMYCSEQAYGFFKNKVMTFSAKPVFHDLSNYISLREKYEYLNMNMNWGFNTDLNKAYELILESALLWDIPQDEMPSTLIVISDMQFDDAIKGTTEDKTLHEMNKYAFIEAGYEFPKLIYWNVRASNGSPVDDLSPNTALISGFNPAIVNPLLSGDDYNPMKVMYEAISHIKLDFTHDPIRNNLSV